MTRYISVTTESPMHITNGYTGAYSTDGYTSFPLLFLLYTNASKETFKVEITCKSCDNGQSEITCANRQEHTRKT